MNAKIAASILSADFARLGEQVNDAVAAGADWIHVDVMDGHFVPNVTIGPPVLKSLRATTDLPLDVHLMIEQPERLIPEFARAGADRITVHIETCPHIHRTIQQIKELGVKAGVTLNPATPLGSLEEILSQVDLVLIMSVNPGFGGQAFIESALNKVREVRSILKERGSSAHIQVDGGINNNTIKAVSRAGATSFVAGSAIFNTENYKETILSLRQNM